ncbi:WecB/TagA/CpsF family glycosyltransferase [Brevibacillus massiliensis]|uniref:WecB/TagA/CpsF family glycosyltransferase n=1 Tax=Brevibacillus massiliensis TaxID=1118054 RepID=UPI0002F55037|nr:WecB/TagA/CpsF family glycosyltransferase [Brevibacillus massiliensis]
MSTARILNVPFSTKSFHETVSDLAERVMSGEGTHVVTANPEIVMLAQNNQRFQSILEQAYVVPDGIGIVYAAKWLGLPIKDRVTGIELVEAMMERADRHGWKVFLFGASPEVNQLAAEKLAKRYPGAVIAGRRDGFFRQEESAEIAQNIAKQKPDILLVALGAPKQEEWIAAYRDLLQVPLMIGVGGSFDVIAGKVKRAPILWQRLHLEWLYRLMKQPSRWKRQLAIPRFVWKVLREKRGQRLQSPS